MSKTGLTFKNMDKWESWLKTVESTELNACKDRILRSAYLRGTEYAQDLTPRRTSRLAQSLSPGAKDHYFEIQVGKKSFVAYGTTVEYARYVEEGFSQADRKGEFVPGVWSSGTFHYIPGAKTGMVLTGKIIPGAHMFRKSLDHLEDDLDKIAEFEFRRLYDKLAK